MISWIKRFVRWVLRRKQPERGLPLPKLNRKQRRDYIRAMPLRNMRLQYFGKGFMKGHRPGHPNNVIRLLRKISLENLSE